MKRLITLQFLLCAFLISSAQDYDVGVFYFPFWNSQDRWEIIEEFNQQTEYPFLHEKRTPIRYPNQGKYYEETNPDVISSQMKIMKDHRIDYVVFDSYWEWSEANSSWGTYFDDASKNIYDPEFPDRGSLVNFHGMDFALRWSSDFATMVAQFYKTDPETQEIIHTGKTPPREGCRAFFEDGGGLDQLVDRWRPLLQMSNYKRFDGKPVIYMGLVGISLDSALSSSGTKHSITNTIEGLCNICTDDPFFNDMDQNNRYESYINWYKVGYFLERFEQKMGFDIYWVAAFTPPSSKYTTSTAHYNVNWNWYHNFPKNAGFDAVSSYTYKYYERSDEWGDYTPHMDDKHCRGTWENNDRDAKEWKDYDYEFMTGVYSKFWHYFRRNGYRKNGHPVVKYHVPVTAGWNRAPLNLWEANHKGETEKYCEDNNHKYHNYDQAISTSTSFKNHLIEAKSFMDSNPDLTDRTVMVCCWNEYFEGTVIEPTLERGYSYVNAIESVFQNRPDPADDEEDLLVPWRAAPSVEEEALDVYPNPVEDLMTIELYLQEAGPLQIHVYDLSGKQAKSLDLELERGKSSIQVNMFDLKPGLYNVEMITEEGKTVRKISVE